jgi:hypothetical protein
MTEAGKVIEDCAALGITLTLGERASELAFDAPVGALTPGLRARIVAHKLDVIEVLFECEERAALMGAADWMDAKTYLLVANDPNVQVVMKTFQAEIVSISCPDEGRHAA